MVLEKFGEDCYNDLSPHKEQIDTYCENNEISLSAKQMKQLLSKATWQGQRSVMEAAGSIHQEVGDDLFDDYNVFQDAVKAANKKLGLKLSGPDLKQILTATSRQDDDGARVIKKVHKLTGSKLSDSLHQAGLRGSRLHDHGYWPSDKAGEFIEYEADSDLRDSEQIPLTDDIHSYFLREVRPHVDEAWLNIDSTKIGHERFNKHFYEHTPLRSLDEVTQEILALEAETEGMLKQRWSNWVRLA